MTSKIFSVALTTAFCAFNAVAQQAPTADQVVGALEKIGGVHPGERRNHIIGICVGGSFVGAKDAQAFTRSALFSGEAIPVIGRFSLAGGNPKAPDSTKNPRGLALQFKLPSNSIQHFTMLNVPVFGAATPQTFYDSLLSNMVDPATGKPYPRAVVVADPALQGLARQKDFSSLLRHPNLTRALDDPKVKQAIDEQKK